jgi:NitT/TauT family transport system substrate-binding protein
VPHLPVTPRPRRSLAAILVVAVLAAGCVTSSSSPAPSAPVKLTVGLGYIPSVQFAPFYLADQAGYYRDAGLDVTFQSQIDPNLITLVGQGSIDVGLADGTSVIPAVSQGIPIQYLATIYGQFPSIVFAKASSGIATAADLKGRKIGIPGRYGSSWVMLQALLGSADLTPNDVTIIEYPDFGQGNALTQGQIDAATGFANNEPVELERSGTKATVLHVDDVVPLPGPGFIAAKSTLDAKRSALSRFIQATLKAMREIAATPSKGVDASVKAVPELGQQRDLQAALLDATIAVWAPPSGSPDEYGTINQDAWESSITYMTSLGMVPKTVTFDDVVEDLSAPPQG